MWLLISAVFAGPFEVMQGPRPGEDLDWLHVVQLETCLQQPNGTIVLTVEASGAVTSVRRDGGTDEEQSCLEFQINQWALKKRNDQQSTRFLLRLRGFVDEGGAFVEPEPEPDPVQRLRPRNGVHVAYGKLKVKGPIKKQAAQEVIQRYDKRIRYCYERVPAEPPYLIGSMTVRLSVGDDGRVLDLRETDLALLDPVIADCVGGRFMRMEFPRKGKRMATIIVPMQFQPSQ